MVSDIFIPDENCDALVAAIANTVSDEDGNEKDIAGKLFASFDEQLSDAHGTHRQNAE